MTSPADLPHVPEQPRPLTFERLTVLADAQGYKVVPAGPNAISGRWDAHSFELAVRVSERSSVLQVRGRRAGAFGAERLVDVASFANDWHRDRLWPTVLWHTDTDGTVVVQTLFTADFTAGATDAQLADVVRLALATSLQCFRALDEPPAVA